MYFLGDPVPLWYLNSQLPGNTLQRNILSQSIHPPGSKMICSPCSQAPDSSRDLVAAMQRI